MTRPTKGRHGFTLVELLVVIAIISILAGLMVPGLILSRDGANKVHCMNNLRGIYMAAFAYSRQGNVFPLAPGPQPRAHESLNLLLAARFGDELEPENFVCLDGEATEAESEEAADGSSRFRLDESTLSYTWAGRRMRSNKRGFLCSDKYYEGYEDAEGTHSGHRGVIMAIDTRGKIHEVPVSKLTENGLLPGLVR